MEENIFETDDSRRLNSSEINQVLHSIDNDVSMLISENLAVMKVFLARETVDVITKMASVVEEKVKSAEKFYSLLDKGETVSTESFIRFLRSFKQEVSEELRAFPEYVLVQGRGGESLTNIVFFDVFINLTIMLQISILAQTSFSELLDNVILKEEYERMKREGLI